MHSVNRYYGITSFLATLIVVAMSVSAAAAKPVTPNGDAVNSKNVIAAIKDGVSFLLKQERLNGDKSKIFWEKGIKMLQHFSAPPGRRNLRLPGMLWAPQYGGETAIVVEALLDVEQSLRLPEISQFTPAMQKPIKFLASLRPDSTYVASFQANAMTLLPNKPAYRQALLRDFRYLLNTIHRDGAYSYLNPPSSPPNPILPGDWDNSNTQYGVLGEWACAHQGLEVPIAYWRLAGEHWRDTQYTDGCWVYGGFIGIHPPNASTGPEVAGRHHLYSPEIAATFTPAGVASLLICDEFTNLRPTNHPVIDPSVRSGLQWINSHFSENISSMSVYSMYGYERVALASGLQQFGGVDWYRSLAGRLLQMRNQYGGHWRQDYWRGSSDAVGTAYALLVLDRGLNPVIMSKLQYTKNYFGPWNARPRDAANFVSWVTRTYESPVNWQVVSVDAPMPQWLNAPILLITGDRDPKFTKSQIAQLREYVDLGGLVFCSGNEGSIAFKRAMLKYGQEVVHNQYEPHVLSNKNYIYTMQPWYHPVSYGQYTGISNGVRDLWVVSNQDISAQWQARRFSNRDAFEVPANLYLYAIGNGTPANRLESPYVPEPKGPFANNITVSQLKYQGNWNPEPLAWMRMGRIAGNKLNLGVTFAGNDSKPGSSAGASLKLLTGTASFKLTPAQVAALRGYLAQGGMLFADAAGGSLAFGDGMHNLIQQLYPHATLESIPLTDPLITGSFAGGVPINKVQYRKFFVTRYGLKNAPRLLGVKQGNRWVIVFSPWDVTSGLLGTNTWGIAGYAPQSAQAIAGNIMLYAIAHDHK